MRILFSSRLVSLVGTAAAAIFATSMQAALPSGYAGRPFNDAAYRAQQRAEASMPKLPYHAFAPALTVFDAIKPAGSGWMGEEEPATLGLAPANSDERRVIRYHVAMPNYRYAAFGWYWAAKDQPGVDLTQYDAVSFSVRVTGDHKPQELFFGVDANEPAPISLREYDPVFLDGSWHRITIPTWAMNWTSPAAARAVRGFAFKTFVWDPADFEVELDQFSFDRALRPAEIAAFQHAAAPLPVGEPQAIPGRVEAAFYDAGGEGVAYHDTNPVNTLSAVLNQQPGHQRPHATHYEWDFRRDEGVDISYTKDWADLNHPNRYDIGANQLYLGSTEDGEWCNYTVNVRTAGTYRIVTAYGNDANGRVFRFSVDGQPAAECRVPSVTGSMHHWDKADVGTITFKEPGVHLLTLHYGRGFNLAYLDFEKVQ